MKDAAVADKVRDIIQPPIEAAGYELVDVHWKHEPGGWVLRVFVDGVGGISHIDCERVSREISVVLDVNDPITHQYSLEVSSPGLDRPLRTLEHFRRFVGDKAKVKLRQGVDGRRNFAGTILSVDPVAGTVTLAVDGREFALPIADLEKANRMFELKKEQVGK